MRLNIDVDLDYHFPRAAEVLLTLEVAQLPDQILIEDLLTVNGSGPLHPITGEDGIGRRTWAATEGPFRARYTATVDIERPPGLLEGLAPDPLDTLPSEVVPYLWPSRYCEADKFVAFVEKHFEGVEGGPLIAAMSDWVRTEMAYVSGSSDTETTAADAFVSRQGVCRDYAHLLTSFARAASIPARLVSAYAWQLEPPDFHAVVEVWLNGAWHLVDPTGLAPTEGMARIAVGRDATDIAFMTIFGEAQMRSQSVIVTRLDE